MKTNIIYCSDCIDKMKELPENSIDAIITDPPYGLNFMGKDWDKFKKGKNTGGGTTGEGTPYGRKQADPSWYQYGPEEMLALHHFVYRWAKECLRILKPGGYLLSFAGSRTYHRIASGIEDAGFEIRDQILWIYGTGFPKSLNIGKSIDDKLGNERKVIGKKEAGMGTGKSFGMLQTEGENSNKNLNKGWVWKTAGNSEWEGWGTNLKPAHEPIVMARKSLEEKTIADNVLKYRTGGINIDKSRISTSEEWTKQDYKNTTEPSSWCLNNNYYRTSHSKGKYPANLIHDGSYSVQTILDGNHNYFYCAKPTREEREKGLNNLKSKKQDESRKKGNPGGDNPRNRGVNKRKNFHPTVKPIKLMKYLVNLITPKNGIVLDPFIGSGTTAIACIQTDKKYIGIEKYKKYCKIAENRVDYYSEQKKIKKENNLEDFLG